MDVLLLSTYELGHQPLNLARPAAHLVAAGHRVYCQDLAVEQLDPALVRGAGLVGISVPMHTATRLGARLAERIRALNPRAHVCFYGLYASLHADVLLGRLADSAIGGEFETPLVALADRLGSEHPACARDGLRGAPTDGTRGVGAGLAPPAGPPHARLAPGRQARDTKHGSVSGAGGASPAPTDAGAAPPHAPGTPIGGLIALDADGGTFLGRQPFLLPRRDLLPPLERYARLEDGAASKVVGYLEASRGCAHRCLHCPITPVYGGRLRVVPMDVVLDDIRSLVALGAEHITFGDPDFFNGIRHSLRIVEALHAEHPRLTFDATIKVEHLLEHRAHLPALARAGCAFVVSAVEAVQDHILAHFQKGHTRADVETALRIAAEAGIPLRPTFVPFTPWTALDDYRGLLDFLERRGLVPNVDVVQYAIRLLVPRGSALVGSAALAPHLGPFDPESFSYRWAHPDPRVDALQRAVAALVEDAIRAGQDEAETFAGVRRLADTAAGQPTRPPDLAALRARPRVPRLSEPWFC